MLPSPTGASFAAPARRAHMQNQSTLDAESAKPRPRTQGRRRDARTDKAIIAATLRLVADHGVVGLSVEAVAAAVGCGKTTIYRRWASKEELVVEALRSSITSYDAADTGSLRGDLECYYDLLLERVANGRVDVLPHLVQVGMSNEALRAALNDFNAQREEPLRQILRRAIDRGELPADVDSDTLMEVLIGPVRYRYHFSGRKLDSAFVRGVLDLVLPHFDMAQVDNPKPSRRRTGSG